MRLDHFAGFQPKTAVTPQGVTPCYPQKKGEGNAFQEKKHSRNKLLCGALPSLPLLPSKKGSEGERESSVAPETSIIVTDQENLYYICDTIGDSLNSLGVPLSHPEESLSPSSLPDYPFSGVTGVTRVTHIENANNNNILDGIESVTLPEKTRVTQGNALPEEWPPTVWPDGDLSERLQMLNDEMERDYWPLPLG